MELDVFRQFKPELVLAICDSVLGVAGKCQARGLIKHTYDEIVHLQIIPTIKAGRLLDAVEKCIEIDKAHYTTFMDILDEELPGGCKKPLSDMAEKLKSMCDLMCTDAGITKGSVIDVPQPSNGIKAYCVPKRNSLKKEGFTIESERSFSRTVSRDSGISDGRSDYAMSESSVSLLTLNSITEEIAPIDETPLPDSTNKKSESCVNTTSKPPVDSISDRMYEFENVFRNLRYDIKQKEAVERSLKEEVKQLRGELERAVDEKNKAKEKINVTEKELQKLKSKRDSVKHTLKGKVEELDGLTDRVSASEADVERLTAQMSEYERLISDQKAEIEQKDQTINDLRCKILELERKNVETVLEYRRSNSTEAEIRNKDIELSLKDAEMKATQAELKQCRKQIISERTLYILLLIVAAVAAYMYLKYKGSDCPFYAL